MKRIIILSVLLVFAFLAFKYIPVSTPKIVYEVIAENGGENGFDFSSSHCNNVTEKNNLHLKNSGYEKRQHPCLKDFSKDVQKLILMCDAQADIGNEKNGFFEVGNCVAEYKIKNKYNYSYTIKE